jgi:hypothetical protein
MDGASSLTFRIYLFYRLREPITEDFDNFGWIRPAGVIDGKILGTATAFSRHQTKIVFSHICTVYSTSNIQMKSGYKL